MSRASNLQARSSAASFAGEKELPRNIQSKRIRNEEEQNERGYQLDLPEIAAMRGAVTMCRGRIVKERFIRISGVPGASSGDRPLR